MNTTVKSPVLIYTEQTPNPETLKFVTNRMLYQGTADFRTPDLAVEWSPLANALFAREEVDGVYISNNFVTVTKHADQDWQGIMLELKDFIKNYVEDGNEIVNEGFEAVKEEIEAAQSAAIDYDEKDAEIVVKIKELINTYVKPAVEMDGGNIEFKKYIDGTVYVIMQGSCSGCPSSTVTLKAGIEGMMKRMVPEVKEVVAEMG
jgi:Fe-S cluster biogenesis protein NfuA